VRDFIFSGLAALVVLGAGHAECRADAPDGAADGPGTRIGGFFRELVGYLKRSDPVGVGDVAPDFELMPLRFYDFDLGEPDERRNARADAYRGVRLSAFKDVKPVALIFGSYT
jgi:hypothetical protein